MQLFRYNKTKEDGFKILILTQHNLTNNIDKIYDHYLNPLKEILGDQADLMDQIVIGSIWQKSNPAKLSVKLIDSLTSDIIEFCAEAGIRFIYILEKDIANRLSANKDINMREVFNDPKGRVTSRFMCGVNYKTLERTVANKMVLDQTLNDMALELQGKAAIGNSASLIEKLDLQLSYPDTISQIESALNEYLDSPSLGFDIEAYSLQTNLASLGSISFAKSKRESIAFVANFGTSQEYFMKVKGLLREFFEQYKGKLIAFNSCYDVRILTYELFMSHANDVLGMRKGIDTLYRDCDDPLFAAFTLRNSTVKPELGLKSLLYPYFGNYGIDVKDIRVHTKEELLEYNSIDALGMHWLMPDFMDELHEDKESLNYYQNSLLRNRKVITECEIVGMPIDLNKVDQLEHMLITESDKADKFLRSLPSVKKTELMLAAERFNKKFSNKRVVKTIKDFKEPFNFNSNDQLTALLYQTLNLPVVLETNKGNPASGYDALTMLKGMFGDDKEIGDMIEALLALSKYEKLLSSFIPAFKNFAQLKDDGAYLCGNLNPIGTISGRLSSNKPNLQNIPTWKPVQECFVLPEGWVMFSADSNALEDRASAIKTNDPSKVKIFRDGFDSHSLKSTYYFPDLLPKIDRDDPDSVLIVKKEYGHIRDESKPITFGKTYGGGDQFLKRKGYSDERVSMINKGWQEMYAHSILHEKEVRASMEANGYIRLLFGLKLHTPALANPASPPWMKAKEMRSAFNAYTQCFGNLNTRAAEEVLNEIKKLPLEIQESIKLCNLIHDNIIGMCKADPEVIQIVNNILIKAMRWQDDDYVRHDSVTMEAEMEIGHDWFNFEAIPNNADIETVKLALAKVEENRVKCL